MFALTGCSLCLAPFTAIDRLCVKKLCVRRKQNKRAATAAAAAATEEESNRVDNSIATSLKLSPFIHSFSIRMFWSSVFITSLCVNNRLFCLFASTYSATMHNCLTYVTPENLLWKVFFWMEESVEQEYTQPLCTRLIYRITRFLFGHNSILHFSNCPSIFVVAFFVWKIVMIL